MKSIVAHLPRFRPTNGWANRILRIDLSSMSIRAQETMPYIPDFLAGRGLANRIIWDEYPEPVDPFDPACPLMVFPGVLSGTLSPYSGRTNICTFAPQGWPYHWFTRSNIGGHFGGELKRAGYDGLVVTGASETPVRILIRDDEVSILPAEELWGQDSIAVIEALEGAEGKGARSLTIGQAGERLSRIATIQTATSSACGMGGFGAVMGAKKLKAITVIGTGQVSLANRERLAEITKAVGNETRGPRDRRSGVKALNERLAGEGNGDARVYSCTESCPSPCGVYYRHMPGCVYKERTYEGQWACVGTLFQGSKGSGPFKSTVFDWELGTRAGFELNMLSNNYGLNQWDIIISMVPWLEACQEAGLISELNGHAMDWRSPEFWAEFLHAMAYREGLGDALADGGWAASRRLQLGEQYARRYYTAWGYSGHWDGHASWGNPIVYPFWLVPALQWLTDTRDPIPSGHGYVHGSMFFGPFFRGQGERPMTWEHMREIARLSYGDPDALDPYSGYRAKAVAAFFHTKHSVMKDTLPADDFIFPLQYSLNSEDRFCRITGPNIGTIDGPSVERHLFVAGTGVDWDEAEYERAANRVYTLERAVAIRHWGRDRAMEESLVLPSFEYLENWTNPLLGQRYALDREQFTPVMDEYYALQGWDPQTGWPTAEHMAELGMADMVEPMADGAARARETVSPPPGEVVPEIVP